jgi:hypothetical protein
VRTSLEAKVGQTINVFFYNPDEVTGEGANLRYTITGFGRFLVTDIESRGVNSAIRGFFVQSVLLGEEMTPGSTRGIMVTGLTQ